MNKNLELIIEGYFEEINQNELFGYDNSIMVFGDAKEMLIKLLSDLKEL